MINIETQSKITALVVDVRGPGDGKELETIVEFVKLSVLKSEQSIGQFIVFNSGHVDSQHEWFSLICNDGLQLHARDKKRTS